MYAVVRGFIGALSTLSVLPLWTGSIEGRLTVPWFPVVGLILGAGVWAVAAGVDMVATGMGLIVGLSVVVAGLVITGGLHVDGLSDSFDGLFGGRDRARRLAIMKDPSVGTFGMVAVFTVLLAKLVATGYLAEGGELKHIVAAYILSRTGQALLASTMGYARAEGGTGKAFVDGVGLGHGVVALGLGVVLLYGVAGRDATLLLITALGLTGLCGVVAQRKIGGVTGDILGATSEVVEAGVLVVAALLAAGPVVDGIEL